MSIMYRVRFGRIGNEIETASAVVALEYLDGRRCQQSADQPPDYEIHTKQDNRRWVSSDRDRLATAAEIETIARNAGIAERSK